MLPAGTPPDRPAPKEIVMAVSKSKSEHPWQDVRAQAKRIGKAKTKTSKRKQIVAWCELAKKALKGGA